MYFNQNENGDGKIVIYYTNCDSVLNQRTIGPVSLT